MTVSILALQALYSETVVRELVDKTKLGSVIWTNLGNNEFQATENSNGHSYDFFASKLAVGNVTDNYLVDVKKDGVTFISIESGAVGRNDTNNHIKELYDVIQCVCLQLDSNIKEILGIVQKI